MTDLAERLYERLLVLRCQTGDEDAYRELVGRFGPRLTYYLRKLVSQADRADDLAQEVWIDVLRQLPRLADAGAFTTWLYRIAHGKAMLDARRNGRIPPATHDVEQVAEPEDESFSRGGCRADSHRARRPGAGPARSARAAISGRLKLRRDQPDRRLPGGHRAVPHSLCKGATPPAAGTRFELELRQATIFIKPLTPEQTMLDKNVGDALLRLDLTPQSETPSAQIERIIDADRRRVQRWTRISIVLWVLAAFGAIVIFVIGGLAFPVIAKLLAEKGEGTLENPDTPFLVLAKLNAISMVLGTASFVTLVAAGIATVILLARSRSATLRQINANLLQISEQLKRTPPGEAPPCAVSQVVDEECATKTPGRAGG